MLGQPLLKNTEDFDRFILSPEALQYLSIKEDNSIAPTELALTNSRLSSANSKWLTVGAVGATRIPLRCDDSSCVFKRHVRPSAASKNRYGEIGCP